MTSPVVTEVPPVLEPVGRDPFIDDGAARDADGPAARAAASARRGARECPSAARPAPAAARPRIWD